MQYKFIFACQPPPGKHGLAVCTKHPAHLGARIRARFAGLGDIQLPIEAREPVRVPPVVDESPAARPSRKRGGVAARRRR